VRLRFLIEFLTDSMASFSTRNRFKNSMELFESEKNQLY